MLSGVKRYKVILVLTLSCLRHALSLGHRALGKLKKVHRYTAIVLSIKSDLTLIQKVKKGLCSFAFSVQCRIQCSTLLWFFKIMAFEKRIPQICKGVL